jgi:hypothetical protein
MLFNLRTKFNLTIRFLKPSHSLVIPQQSHSTSINLERGSEAQGERGMEPMEVEDAESEHVAIQDALYQE